MKKWTWLTSGFFILVVGIIGMMISVSSLRPSSAQDAGGAALPPPSNELPPPSNELPPPMVDLPPPGADFPPVGGAVGDPPVAGDMQPPTSDLPPSPDTMPPMEGGAPLASPGLDASQDPGLRTSNPEGYVYDPSGRRDPFLPPATILQAMPKGDRDEKSAQGQGPDGDPQTLGNGDPLLSYYVRDYKLIGILWDVREPRAMVRAPNNQVYTVQLKMKLGRENALVAAIREKEVVVVEPNEKGDYKGGETRVLRMKN